MDVPVLPDVEIAMVSCRVRGDQPRAQFAGNYDRLIAGPPTYFGWRSDGLVSYSGCAPLGDNIQKQFCDCYRCLQYDCHRPVFDCSLLNDGNAGVLLTPELRHLENLLLFSSPCLRSRTICELDLPEGSLPVSALELGSENDGVPVLVFVGGVHGVERIGSQVVLAFLETLIQRLRWDQSLIDGLKHLRLVFIPVLNPAGLIRQTRANGRGVDLMRNAPVDARKDAAFLVGGHRLGCWLPWYRGKAGTIEPEAQALFDLVMAETER